MEYRDNVLVVVDAGHGGWDNGASWQGRLEKDDNLRLALELQKQLEKQGVKVLMTRDTDVFVELSDRAAMANRADADLFVSLHRNSYIEQTPLTNGVENWIYLTAPEETSGRAAALVLNEVVLAGVQNNRGVKRGNYYVLRRTAMPAMLLEMGYIINDVDNCLFDKKLEQYAQAITRGILCYFNLPYYSDVTAPTPPLFPQLPTTCLTPSDGLSLPPSPVGPFPYQPVRGADGVSEAQMTLNQYFNSGLTVDGDFGPLTNAAFLKALQSVSGNSNSALQSSDNSFDPQIGASFPEVSEGDAGETVALVQALLSARGYDVGGIDGIFGRKTKSAVMMFQRDHYLKPDGVAGPLTIKGLLE